MWARGLNKRQRSESEKKIQEYWKEAKSFAKARGDWFAFGWNSDARWKWEQYFAWRLGFVPVGLNYLKWGTINEFLVPCENPQEFDPRYRLQREIMQ
jgi:hypothetical protein